MARTFAAIVLAGLTATAVPTHAIAGTGARTKASGGPTLAQTLDFIRSKLSQEGKISYAGFTHDASDNSDWVNQFQVEASNVSADPASCSINYHWTTAVDGKSNQDFDTAFEFAKLDRIALSSMEADVEQISSKQGHPTWTSKINPSIWVVTATNVDGSQRVVDFRDQALAERVVSAMNHGMKLCGGAKHEAF
jgi:hypothetical protein